LEPQHPLHQSSKQMKSLIQSISENGIMEPIEYVKHEGTKFVLDGHHRLGSAHFLGMDKVPAVEVSLPHEGYSSTSELRSISRSHFLKKLKYLRKGG
jgi:ParB-like chromosome segregation protein Spo0J